MNEDRASRYHRLRRRADLAGAAAAAAVLLWLVLSGGALGVRETAAAILSFVALPAWAADPATAALVALQVLLLLAIVEMPFAWYQGFVVEHAYGLSNQTLGHWMRDHAKGLALAVGLGMAGAAVVYAALGWSRDWWWLASALVCALASIGLAQVAPVVLLPLFFAVKPLDRPALVARLLDLSRRAGTSVVGVFEWTLSAHTKKANAALAGLGRTRRILLADTLLADYSDDEIEVILAHELSHHVHHDLGRGIALFAGLLVAGFFLAHLLLGALAGPLGLAGLADPAGLPLLLLVGAGWLVAMRPIVNLVSRRHEQRADRYALEMTGNVAAFLSAMKRLSQQNLAEDDPSPLVKAMYYAHPPIRERLAAARAWSPAGARPR
ncbi:MAG: M48 family metallopeptidase [Acidobacteriota bacterium]